MVRAVREMRGESDERIRATGGKAQREEERETLRKGEGSIMIHNTMPCKMLHCRDPQQAQHTQHKVEHHLRL